MKSKRPIKKERRQRGKFLSAILVFAMVITMVNPMTVFAAGESQDSTEGGFLSKAIESVVDFFTGGDEGENAVEAYAVENADKVVDGDTTADWNNFTAPGGVTSTQNVGRIWTDKSVFSEDYTLQGSSGASGQKIEIGDSDFLVGLSALSSTSNLKTITTTTTPLDIVLVVDTSGSMDNGQGDSMGYAYNETYNVRNNSRTEYYVQLENGEWQELSYDRDRGWYYNAGSLRDPDYRIFEPKTSADDNDPDHTQFYTREQVNKMEALQSAANTFADAVAEMNDSISDTSKQHRISLVKFASDENNSIGNDTTRQGYNCSQVVSDLTAYTTNTVSGLKSTINRLYGEGATRADFGLHQAQRVLNGEGNLTGAREEAQKVVIFFTDGNPTSGSNWEDDIASSAVDYARSIKQGGTTIYSIGVVQGADPSDDPNANGTSNINKFLHAVSSNYKNASYSFGWFSYNWSFGERTTGEQGEPNPDYYFAATDADELDQVFEDITSSITDNLGSGSPIEENTSQGNTNPGTLTFTDQLGSYMQVTGIGEGEDKMQLVYGDRVFTSTNKETVGNTDTYKFEGTVEGNAVYGEADLSTLVVKVERSDNLSIGDIVTVELPASLIPLRNYDVDTNASTMTVTPAYPIRLFFGVSVKSSAVDALNDPSSNDYKTIITNNKSSDGTKVEFYSNSFTQGAEKGATTVSFSPNIGNRFYYYTEDAQLYLDEGFQTPATRSNQNQWSDTLYYKDTYWKVTGDGSGEETTSAVAVTRTGGEWDSIQYDENRQAYIPSGTKRTDRPATLVSAKEDPQTGTATNVLVPEWIGDDVTQYLGNNGKLSLAMPGQLEIKKQVNWGNASDETKESKNSFTFAVQLEDAEGTALTGTYPYYVDGSGAAIGNLELTNGEGKITINGGQSVYIDGLPAGTAFTVTEEAKNSNGFTTIDSTTQQGAQNIENDGVVSGTIAAGAQISTTFTNTYHASDVDLSTDTTLKVKKNLTGRDWRDSDTFTFEIDGLGNTAGSGITTPEPDETTVTVTEETENKTVSFGDITFTAPGEYHYAITEDSDTEPIPGIDYSAARYRVSVTVTDNGKGALVISDVTIEQRQNDDGMEPEQQPSITEDTVVFTNIYDVTNGTTNIDGTKEYHDTTGGNPINADKFTFQMEALGGYETEGGSSENYTVAAEDVPMPAGSAGITKTVYNIGYGFGFGTISYDGNDIGKTFEYKITELAQDKSGDEEKGMTYDTAKAYTVKVTVEEVTDDYGTHIVATPNLSPQEIKFINTYDPTDVTIGADGIAPIQGTKTLNGRDMKDGESFYFQLTQTGGPATDSGKFVTVLEQPETISVSKDNMTNGSADFDFSNLTFSKVGTYTFAVNEVSNINGDETADGSGMTYDTNIATVTVKVTDNLNGTLKADVTYSNDKHGDTTDKAVFTNTYEASMDYGTKGAGGITVTKQLTNRPMSADEFAFTITGTESDTVTAEDAAGKLAEGDENFQNTAAAANDTVRMAKFQNMTFDQDDAGKTFSYIVDETEPEKGNELAGVTYDQTQYRVDIEVVDNGNGSMHTLTTVTKIKDADGQEITAGTEDSVVIDKADSDADGYTVPTFGFVNEYNPTPAVIGEGAEHQIQVTKHVEGADSPDGVNYRFTLTATGNNVDAIEGLDDQKQLHVSTKGIIKDGEEQTQTFAELRFTRPGTYTFTVAEDQPEADEGWDFDTEEKTVTVIVTDLNEVGKYDGKLHIDSVTGSPVVVNNVYEAGSVIVGGDDADQQINVKKTVTGQNSNAEFKFKIAQVDEDDTKWDNVEVVDPDGFSDTVTIEEVTQNNSKMASFDAIRFNKEGTYQFTITEEGAKDFNDGETRNGWTYDEHAVTVTVNVTDKDKDGFLEATISYDNSEAVTEADKSETDVAAFTNTYKATGVTIGPDTDDGIKVQKTLTGRNWTEDEEYTFTITNTSAPEGMEEEDIPMPDTTSINIGRSANGNVNTAMFGEMTFTQAGTYVYGIRENTGDDTGMIYDSHVATVTVAVFEAQHDIKGPDGEVIHAAGTLWAQVQYDNSSAGVNSEGTEDDQYGSKNDQLVTDAAAFTNIQKVEGSIDLTGKKVLEGRDFQEGDAFTFHVEAEDGAPMPDKVDEDGYITINPTESNKAEISFGQIKFTEAGEYIYHITEQTGDAEGMTYDTARRDLIITVTNDGQGSLKAEITVGSDQLTWTNSWTFQPGDPVSLDGTKTLTGKQLEKEQFTFKVEPQNGAPMGDTLPANFNGDATQNEDGSWTAPITLLQKITFESAGDYVYLITEVNDGQPGITYDASQYRVTVQVAQDGTTTTKVEKSNGNDTWFEIPDGSIAFNNSYAAEGEAVLDGSANLAGTKTLTGRDWINTDSFTFILAAGDEATEAAVEADEVSMPRTMVTVQGGFSEGAAVPFNFGDIRFREAGDYTFTISEQQPGDEGAVSAIAGITYDEHVRTIKVHVADNGRGRLTAEVAADGTEGDTNWTNVYEADPTDPVDPGESTGEGTGNVRLTKVLEGKNWGENDEFTFEITAKDEASEEYTPNETRVTVSRPDGKDSEGNDLAYINFNEITFDKEGTFTYEVREVTGDNAGMTYSSNVATITINVSDNLQGAYTAVVNISNSTFTNVYSTEVDYDAHAAINVTKVLNGHDMEAGQFRFDVKPDDQESADKLGIDPDGLTLNSSEAAKGDKAVMSLLGRNNVTFTQEDAGKTYSYTISEQGADNAPEGYEYDGDVYTLTIEVSDDGDGTLSVVTTVSNGEDYTMSETITNRSEGVTTMEVPFNNTYNATGTLGGDGEGAVKINATKELTNRDQVAGEFKFNVTNSKEENGEPVATGTNAADGTVTFDPIEYTTEGMLEDVANGIATAGKTDEGNDTYTYQYTVAEDEASFDEGVTAIEGSFQITVTVTDNNDGTLDIAVTYPEGSNDSLTFRNAYGAGEDGTAVLNIKGAKDLDVESGNNVPDIAGRYTFELSGSEGAPMPDNTTAKNDAAGNVSFGDITYTMENVFGEAASDDSSASADQPAEPETPAAGEAVTGNEGGSAADTADVPADETDGTEAGAADETGSADAEADAQSADNAAQPEAAQPEAEQQDTGETAGDNVQTTSVEPAMTGNDGISALSTVRQKTFTYTVTETGSVAGVTNDAEASKTFDVTVTDNGDGTLSVTTDGVPGALFTFTNTYSVTPTDPTDPTNPDDSGETAVTITKELTGRDMAEGEFSFVMKDANGETVSEAKNAADGSVKFTGITFDTPGTYSYTISEVQGNAGGVTYDSSIYKATATVTDNSDGTLSAVWSVTDADGNAVDSIVFRNEYSYSGTTTVTLGATKALDGREMKEGEFNFLLKDSDGETVAEAANSENGAVQFEELSFDTPGTYEYTISEEKGDDAAITYDDTVYSVTINVEDSGEGYLTASVDFGGETPVFTNTYTAPEEPSQPADTSDKGDTPKADKVQKAEPAKTTTVQTGDSSPVMTTVIVMAAALVVIIAVLVMIFRRRNGR